MENVGVKSKKRVKELGEVYTPDSIVQDMMDASERGYKANNPDCDNIITASFLEPTCGDGQILIRIYSRKLEQISKLAETDEAKLRKILINAILKVYGIDIDPSNITEAKTRILTYLFSESIHTFDVGGKILEIKNPLYGVDWYMKTLTELKEPINNIINNNIIIGDMLKCHIYDSEATQIVAYDWVDNTDYIQVYPIYLYELFNGCNEPDNTSAVHYSHVHVLDVIKNYKKKINGKVVKYEKIYIDLKNGLKDKYAKNNESTTDNLETVTVTESAEIPEVMVKSEVEAVKKPKKTSKTENISMSIFK